MGICINMNSVHVGIQMCIRIELHGGIFPRNEPWLFWACVYISCFISMSWLWNEPLLEMFVRRWWLQEGRQMSKFRAESWVAYLTMRFIQRSVYLNCRWPNEAALNIFLSSRAISDSVYLYQSVCLSGHFYLLLFLHFSLHQCACGQCFRSVPVDLNE